MSEKQELWIGLVEAGIGDARPEDVDADAGGAFLTFVAPASGAGELETAAAAHLVDEGWVFVRAEDVEPVAARLAAWQPEAEVLEVIERVRRTGVADSADTWDIFPSTDQ